MGADITTQWVVEQAVRLMSIPGIGSPDGSPFTLWTAIDSIISAVAEVEDMRADSPTKPSNPASENPHA